MPGLQCKMKTAVACRSSMSWWHNDTCCTSLLKKVVLKQLLRWPRWPQLRRTVATGYVEICRDVEMSRYVVHRCAQYVVLVASAWQEPDASAKERQIMTNRHNIALRRLYHSRFVKSRWTQFPPIYIYIYTVYVRLFAQHFHLSFLEGSCVVLCQHLSWNQLSTPTRLAAPHLQRPDQGHNRHSTQRGKSTGSSRPVLVEKNGKRTGIFV